MNPKAQLKATKGLLVAAKKMQETGVENADEMVDWFEKEIERLETENNIGNIKISNQTAGIVINITGNLDDFDLNNI